MISLAEAVATAQKQMHNQPTASASQAAKKLEESRARPAELIGAQSSAVSAVGHHDATRAKAPTPVTRPAISTASAAAAAFEANMIGKRKIAQPSVNATPSGSQQPKGTTWTDSKPFRPNAKEPAAIEVDYSWTRTGGNAWSNKYRLDLPKTAQGAINGWSQPQQHVHQQQAHKHHQAQHPHQTQRQQQQPQHHQRHYSVPVHPTHQAQPRKAQPQQNPSAAWRGWGREGVDEMEGTYTESDEETTNGWNIQQGGDGWGRSSGGWAAQQPAGKHNKAHGQHRKSEDHRDKRNGWGQQPVKDHWAQTNDGWGQDQWGQGGGGGGGGDGWGKEGDEWGQGGGGGGGDAWGQGGRGGGDAWGQGRGGDAWGQGGGGGGGGGDAWGHGGGGGEGDAWGHGGGGGGEGDAWGQGGGGGGDAWGQGGGGAANGWSKGAADGWGEGEGEVWGQQAQGGKTGWGNTLQQGWGNQAEGAGRASLNNEWGGTTQAKVKSTAAEAAGSRNVVSPQQRSQILNSLLNNQPQTQNNHAAQLSAAARAAQIAAAAKYQAQMKGHQGHQGNQGHHQERREAWEAEESSDGWGSDEDEEGEHNRRVHFSPKFSEVWGGSPRSIPTKALAHAHAQQGIKTTLINDASNVRFAESKGAAFAHVANAFFGNARLARERIHWLFPPNKDKRVAEMLAWVQKMSFNLGTYGVSYPYLLTSHIDTYN